MGETIEELPMEFNLIRKHKAELTDQQLAAGVRKVCFLLNEYLLACAERSILVKMTMAKQQRDRSMSSIVVHPEKIYRLI